jgi:hypothetical protein
MTFRSLILLLALVGLFLAAPGVQAQTTLGGVGNATGTAGQPLSALWLEADRDAYTDAGCSTLATDNDPVRCWQSQSAYQEGGTPTRADIPSGLDAPRWVESVSGLGGQPAVRFSRAQDDGLGPDDLDPINAAGPYGSHQFHVVFRTGADVTSRQVIYEEGGRVNGLNLYIDSGDLIAYAWSESESWVPLAARTSVSANQSYVVTVAFDGSATDQLRLYVNDADTPAAIDSDPSVGPLAPHSGDIALGNVANDTEFDGAVDADGTGGYGFDGWIADFAHYETVTNDARRRIVMTALAAKYGISVTGQRFAYGGTTGFGTRVAGIGRDTDGSEHLLAASEELTLVATAAGPGAFTTVGHNDLPAAFAAETDVPGIGTRLQRVWRFDRSGSTTTDLEVDLSGFTFTSGQAPRLLVEPSTAAGSFGTSTTVLSGTVSGNTFTVDAADVSSIADGSYLTLAKSEVPGPTSITYSPASLTDRRSDLPQTSAAPTVDADALVDRIEIDDVSVDDVNASGTPTVTFGDLGSGSDIEIDPQTGEITGTASTAVGIYRVDVRVTDEQGKSVVETDAYQITVQEEVRVAYSQNAQSINPGESMTPVTPEILTDDAGAMYQLIDGNIGSLPGATFPGVTFTAATGEISGTPGRTGTARAVIRAIGNGTGAGDDTTEVHVSIVDGNGPAGVGDDNTLVVDLNADALSLADGDPVPVWPDASVFNLTVDPSDNARRPTYRATGLNGRPAVEFDGTDDYLRIEDTDQLNNGGEPYDGRTISIAFQSPSDLTDRQVIYEEGGTVRGINLYVLNGDLISGMWNLEESDDIETTPWGPHYFRAGTSEHGEPTVTLQPDTPYVLTFEYEAAAERIAIYLNGQVIGRTDATQPVGRFFDHNNGILGAQANGTIYDDIGADSQSEAYYFQGRIGRVVQHDVALSESQRRLVESVLGDTYGAAVTPSSWTSPASLVDIVGVGATGLGDAHDPVVHSSIATLNSPDLAATPAFALFGHDDAGLFFVRDDSAPTDYRGDGNATTDDFVGSRLDRTWYLDETNTPDFDLAFDVTGLDPRTGQFVLIIDTDPSFTPSSTVIEGTTSGGTTSFSDVGANFNGDAYFTLARTVGMPGAVADLTYSPNPISVENGTATPVTATATFSDGNPIPTFSIVDVLEDGSSIATPPEFTIDDRTGDVTVDPSTALQGSFEVVVEADNGEGAPGVDTLRVNIFEPIATLTYTDPSQTVTFGDPVSVTVDQPVSDGISGASYTYSLLRVSAFGSVQADLSGTGLSLATDGSLTGTLSQPGVVSAEVQVTASDGASGTASAYVMVSSIGNDGPAGIGDSTSTILHLNPLSLIDLEDGDDVPTWEDSGQKGNDAAQGSSGDRPVYRQRTGAVNGNPVVDFAGGTEYFDLSDSDDLNTQDVTLQRSKTIVFRPDDVTTRQVLYEEGAGVRGISLVIESGSLTASAWNFADDGLVDGGEDPTTPWEDDTGGDGIVLQAAPVSPGQVYVATLTLDFVEGTLDLIVNGTTVGSDTGAGRLYSHGGDIGLGGAPDTYYAGTTEVNTRDPFDGVMGDVIFSTSNLNEAQRRILHNALGTQYSAAIASADDRYNGDATDHDIDVLGVGRETATAQHTSARRGGLQLDVSGGLDDGDYLIAGHDTRQNSERTSDIATGSGSIAARMLRTWYVSRTEPASSDLTTDLTIDLSEAGLPAQSGNASGYRLIHRPAGDPVGSTWTVDGTSATVTGDAITFSGVSLTNGHVYTLATTDRGGSPIGDLTITIRGTAGTAPTGRIGSDRGYRFIGPLVTGADASSLEFADGTPFLQFPTPQGSIFYTWNETIDDPTQTGTQEGWWEAGSASTPLPPGRGALLYVLDDPTYAVDPDLEIHFDDALDPVSVDDDILVDNLNQGSQFHFLANSYPVPYDLAGLNTDVDADSDGNADFKAVVQVFDATTESGTNEPTDNAVGTYLTRTSDIAQDAPNREVAPGQGFFVERNDADGSTAQSLTFDASSVQRRLLEPPRYIGSEQSATTQRPDARMLALQFTVRDKSGKIRSVDRAVSAYFREGAREGEDRFDASKFTPLSAEYALLGLQGPDRAGDTQLWAQRSWPIPESVVEVPIELHVSGLKGTAEIAAPRWDQVPEDWSATLVDTRGTADPTDDVEHVLQRDGTDPYVFSLDGFSLDGASSATASNSRASNSRASNSRASQSATTGGPASESASSTGASDASGGLPAPRMQRLAPKYAHRALAASEVQGTRPRAKQSRARQEGETPPARFQLRVDPGTDALPVALSAMTARADGEDLIVEWETLTEANNAGFGVQMQRLAAGDTTASADRWTEAGFVDGSGTTDQPQSYQYRIHNIGFGRHSIRLRQVDTDGTVTYSEPQRVELTLTEPYQISKPYPNPVQTTGSIDLAVREAQDVRVEMYDILGRRVAVLRDGPMLSNRTETLTVESDGLASGHYFVRVIGDDFVTTRRVTVVR